MIRSLKFLMLFFVPISTAAQIDSTLLRRIPVDTSIEKSMNMDAVYNRPFLQFRKTPVSIGGYLEMDYQYMGEDGITDGHSFALPRMTVFIASTISQKIKFLSELEIEEGGKSLAESEGGNHHESYRCI